MDTFQALTSAEPAEEPVSLQEAVEGLAEQLPEQIQAKDQISKPIPKTAVELQKEADSARAAYAVHLEAASQAREAALEARKCALATWKVGPHKQASLSLYFEGASAPKAAPWTANKRGRPSEITAQERSKLDEQREAHRALA